MNNIIIVSTVIFIIIFRLNSFSGIIILKNGQTAKTEIVDTSGSTIVILRQDKRVVLKKKIVSTIILHGDTISYKNYTNNLLY